MGFELSDFTAPSEGELCFSITCLAVVNGSAKLDITTECIVDSSLGETSNCIVTCTNDSGNKLFESEIIFHNGNGYENEEGLMEASDSTEYDDHEMGFFKDNLIDAIDSLNPYPAILQKLSYETKGSIPYIADFPCEECGKIGVSINESFLPIGQCCHCGFDNELIECERCEELYSSSMIEDGLCPSCHEYFDKQ